MITNLFNNCKIFQYGFMGQNKSFMVRTHGNTFPVQKRQQVLKQNNN